ncbi:glycosyltransferase family 2 protein [Chloroflexia bacterium SDU3-3]|nr:glycosyltransferase family 2 protein [Chloroflexia bacterium SDU3-3]
MSELAIIIVSWNTRDLLQRCIEHVHSSLAGAGLPYRVVVVDNASHDGTPAMLRAEHPDVVLIEPGRNLGFAGGNNLALRWLLGMPLPAELSIQPENAQPGQPQWLLLLNPDTEPLADALPQLVRYIQAHPDVAAVGPRLLNPDGSTQPSRRRFPDAGVFFLESTPLEQLFPHNRWAARYRMEGTPDDAEQDVDWLVGAALLVRRSAVERAGLLDAGFAMYSEELEWQLRLRRAGRVVYLPAAQITHYEGKSSEQVPARRLIHFQQSRLRYVRMVFGPIHALPLWATLVALYSAQLATEAAKWLLGHKRPLRAQRVAVYRQVLAGLLAGPEAETFTQRPR